MKNIISKVFAFFLLTCQALQSQNFPTKAEQVTFFRSGVQISRSGQTTIQPGIRDYTFKGFSSKLNPASLQVTAEGNFTILSVSNKINYLDSVSSSTEYKDLEASLLKLVRSRDDLKVYHATYTSEEELWTTQHKLKNQNTDFSVDALLKLADVYRTRLVEVRKKINDYQYQISKTDEQINQIKKQMDQLILKNQNAQGTMEIIVSIESKLQQNGQFTFHYYVPDAGWNSSYDIRVSNIHSPLQLKSKADVWQNTNENWDGVWVTLSTGDPNRSFQIPELSPWWIQIYDPVVFQKNRMSDNMALEESYPANARTQIRTSAQDMEPIVQEQITTLEFKIPEKWKIESSQIPKTMVIQTQEVQTHYQYIAIPKKSNYAFLKAEIADWEHLNLSMGVANIYFMNTFVGSSYINPTTVNDTLSISLGPDIAVNVSRIKSKDLSKKIFLSDKKQQWVAWDIKIQNNKPDMIHLIVEDQLPLSNNASIEITPEELDGASLDKETGILRWNLEVKPTHTIKKKWVYSLRFPKGIKPILD